MVSMESERAGTVAWTAGGSRPTLRLHRHPHLHHLNRRERDEDEGSGPLPLPLKNPVDLLRIGRAAKAFADGAVIQELGDRRESTEMRLKLILRDDEEDDVFDRCVVEGVELNAFIR